MVMACLLFLSGCGWLLHDIDSQELNTGLCNCIGLHHKNVSSKPGSDFRVNGTTSVFLGARAGGSVHVQAPQGFDFGETGASASAKR